MRVIRNKDVAGTVESRVPPGAYIAKFYRDGELEVSIAGRDSHPTGAQLIRVNCFLDAPSLSGDVIIGVQKNGEKFAEVTILEGETAGDLDLVGLDLAAVFDFVTVPPSLDFRAVVDYIQAEIVATGTGAEKLTVQCVFDR